MITVDNRVQRPRDLFRNVWKMIFPIHHYITEIARFDWLSFSRALQREPSVQNLSLLFATIT